MATVDRLVTPVVFLDVETWGPLRRSTIDAVTRRLRQRNVPAVSWVHAPSPVHGRRFMRVGLQPADSMSLFARLIDAGVLSLAGEIQRSVATADLADAGIDPVLWTDVAAQLRICQAEPELYSDWAARLVG